MKSTPKGPKGQKSRTEEGEEEERKLVVPEVWWVGFHGVYSFFNNPTFLYWKVILHKGPACTLAQKNSES